MKSSGGFSLTELLVTISVSSIVILGVNSILLAIATQQIKSEQKLNAQDFLSNAVRLLETDSECDRSLKGLKVSNINPVEFQSKNTNVEIVRADKVVRLSTTARIKPKTLGRAFKAGSQELYRQILQVEFRLAARPTRAPSGTHDSEVLQPMVSRYAEIPIVTTEATGGTIVSCKSEIGPELSCIGMGWVWEPDVGCHPRPTNVCVYQGTYSVSKKAGQAIRPNGATGQASCPEGSTRAITGQTNETITYTCMSCT